MSNDFQDLLQDAEQLRAQIDQENTGLPRLQRTFSQLLEAGQRKLAKASYLSTDPNAINASILLAGKGIDAPRLTQTIENLQTTQLDQQQQQLPKYITNETLKETSIQNYLRLEKEVALMSTIEETRKDTLKQIEESYWRNSEYEWEKQKQKIMNALHGSNTDLLNIVQETAQFSPNLNGSITQGRSLMNDVQMAFAKVIYLYNEQIISNVQEKPNLLEDFLNITKNLKNENIEDAWNMLNYMTNINITLQANNPDSSINERVSLNLQSVFIDQAIKYLENTFKGFLKNAVSSNLEQARIGGKLGTLQLITGYLRLNPSKYYSSYEETYTDNQQPLWSIIFLCLRCGDYEAAKQVALKSKKDDIANYIHEFMINNRYLCASSENKLKLEYKGRIKRSQDSYKRAVYRYLCRYEIDDDLSDVLDNVDDFLWFHLSSITLMNKHAHYDHHSHDQLNTSTGNMSQLISQPTQYQDFQYKMSVEYGENYFCKSRNPFPYLQVLLLTSQFELAIEFLLKYDNMIVHAVHMAIALYEKSLLNLTKSTVVHLINSEINDPKGTKRLNFASLIKTYTRKFECTDPRDALEYYYFLRNINNQQNKNYFAMYISELALETREFELLFGKLEKNGSRKPGAIDKFLPKTDEIIGIVAKEIENKGLTEEAIKLYDLCKQQQRVLELCIKLISQVVSELNTPNSNRDRLKQMALSIAERYKNDTTSKEPILKSTSTTFYLLVDLMSFFDIFHADNFDLAYDTLNRLQILPKTSDDIETKVKQFTTFSEEIKRHFPYLLLTAMTIIRSLYSRMKTSSPMSQQSALKLFGTPLMASDGGKRIAMNDLKDHAKTLIRYVGCIPYRLPGDTNARLLQLESLLN